MRLVLVWLMLSVVCGTAHAGMMGNGMRGGGMMDSGSATSSPPPAALGASARKGYERTRRYCVQCHAPPTPDRHTAAEWPRVIDRMERYMRQQGRVRPNGKARHEILEYLDRTASR